MGQDPVYDAQIHNIWTAFEKEVRVDDPSLQIQPYIKEGVAIIKTNGIRSQDELAALLPPSAISNLIR